MRLVKENSFRYGFNDWSVEARTVEQLSEITRKLDSMGWKDANTECECDTDYGFATSYAVDCSKAEEFKADFKQAKKTVSYKPVRNAQENNYYPPEHYGKQWQRVTNKRDIDNSK